MKGLNIEDKDSFKEYLVQPITSTNTPNCPFYNRSFISSTNTKSSKPTRALTINLIANLNNLNSSKLSESSPIQNNESKNNNDKKRFKFDNIIQNLIKFPEIKEFNSYYEIPFHGKYDFVFLLRGNLEKTEWTSKTKKLRAYPRHLKNTLFYQDNNTIKEIHKQNFNKIYQIFIKIKNEGLNLYNNKQFKECLDKFNYAYGLFKWIEFKDKEIILKEKINSDNFTILDSDIEEKRIISSNNENENKRKEEEIKKACLIYILEIMAYCNIELRLFSHAIECLEECTILAQNCFPDVYLRYAQARMLNKKSSYEELKLAEKDINKAINLVHIQNNKIDKNMDKIDISIYYKIKNRLNQIMKKNMETKVKYIKTLLKKELNLKIKRNNNSNNENVLYIIHSDIKLQYKILKEIKKKYILAFKFFSETKNNAQLNLTYKEYEYFYDVYHRFKFFFKFNQSLINETILKYLNSNEKKILYDLNSRNLINKNKMKICEYIFMNANYNKELYKYAVDKILEEEKADNENCEKLDEVKNEINYCNRKCFMIKSSACFIILILISVVLQIFYLKSIRRAGYKSLYK